MLIYIERMMKNLYTRTILPIAIMLLLLSNAVLAAQTQPLDSIRSTITAFIAGQTGHYAAPAKIKIARLDPRLKLSLCNEPITAFQPPGSRTLGNITIGVRCSGVSPWTIYVSAYVQVFQPVAVSSHPLSRGKVITADDIKMVERDLAALKLGYMTDNKQAIGMVIKRSIGPDAIITPHLVEAPRLVRRGEQVTIVAESTGVEIHATGKALADGARGDLIRVRNITSKKVIEAVVTNPGVVKVRTQSQFR